MIKLNADTKITGIFGYPVKHSLSPAMQNRAFKELGLNCVYLAFEVKPEDLKASIKAVRTIGLLGINLTIPHKERVLRYLDDIDPLAERTGSVNTVLNEKGKLKGFSTDGPGFINDLKEKGFSVKSKTALIIGYGGAAKAAACALEISGSKKIIVTGRNRIKALKFIKKLRTAEYADQVKAGAALKDIDLIVNATPIGMNIGDPSPIGRTGLYNTQAFVYDMIYNRRTALLSEASRAGLRNSGGLGMLAKQGALAFQIWTGKKAPVELMEKTINKAFKAQNKQ